MTDFFGALLRLHLTCAFSATAAFWVAACAPKGQRLHRAAGRWFARLIYATAATGAVMALAQLVAPGWVHSPDPSLSADAAALADRLNRQTMWLVLYVLLIIVAPVQHGLAVIAAAATPARVRSPLHAVLNVVSVFASGAMLAATVVWQHWIFLIVTPIGAIVGLRNMTYAGRRGADASAWEREHLTSMVTAGITLHTALFVFGTSRSLALQLEGAAQLLPWTAPAVVGLVVIVWLRGRRFTARRTGV